MTIFILLDWKLSKNSQPWLKTELEKVGYIVFLIGIPNYKLTDRTSKTGQTEDRIFLLHDVYSNSDEQCDYKESGSYVFTGGEASRDWTSFIRCAEEMPNIEFIGVARRKSFNLNNDLPENLKMYFDVPESIFYSLLKESRIVFLPLMSKVPCGLIVLIRAALLSKPVIATRTPSIKNYIIHNKTGLLVDILDIDGMKNTIEKLFYSSDLRKSLAEKLKQHVVNNFSSEQNAKVITEIIEQ